MRVKKSTGLESTGRRLILWLVAAASPVLYARCRVQMQTQMPVQVQVQNGGVQPCNVFAVKNLGESWPKLQSES